MTPQRARKYGNVLFGAFIIVDGICIADAMCDIYSNANICIDNEIQSDSFV